MKINYERDYSVEIDTKEKKIIYLMGFLQALAAQHAEKFNRDIEDVKREILEGVMRNK